MARSIFRATAEGRFMPGEDARGPWDPRSLHGGAPAALITRAFEQSDPHAGLPLAYLRFQFLRPVPLAELTLTSEVLRSGRRVQELAALLSDGDGRAVCRAGALRVLALPRELPRRGPEPAPALPGPESGTRSEFALNPDAYAGFATTGMEMSWLSDPDQPGPSRVWMRLREPLVADERPSPLVHLAASADFGNGVSAELPFNDYLFINADLTIQLWRQPRGEWVGLDSRTLLLADGIGTSESVLHDTHGPIGRAAQTLVVQAR